METLFPDYHCGDLVHLQVDDVEATLPYPPIMLLLSLYNHSGCKLFVILVGVSVCSQSVTNVNVKSVYF